MQLLTFRLGETKYGIALEYVQSIEQMIKIVSIPNTLSHIRGIMNLHGEVIPLYSLTVKFGFANEEALNIVVVEVDGMKVGLEVCRVEEILTVPDDHVFSMPLLIQHDQNFFSDVAYNQKNLIVTLDVHQLITLEEQENMKEMLANNE